MKHLRLRDDLIAGAHPSDGDSWLVYQTTTGRQWTIPSEGWRLLEAFDGKRSPADIARATGQPTAVVEGFAERLTELGLLSTERAVAVPRGSVAQWSRQRVDGAFTIRTHPDARFECSGAGSCCRQGYVIPLDEAGAERARRAALRVLGPDVDPVGLLPTKPGQPWTYALDNESTCPFLDDESRCRIHERAAYPDACRIFPFVFARFGDDVFASVAHRCVCGTLGGGPNLSKPSLDAKVRRAGSVFTVPGETVLDASRSVDSAIAVAALIGATDETDPFAILTSAAERLGAKPRGRSADREEISGSLCSTVEPWGDSMVTAALSAAPHPERRSIRADLRRGELFDPKADARAEVGRFVRDHLYGLRPYHYPTLSAGLLAVALAARSILEGLPRAAHPAARERVMLWEEALTTDALPRAMAIDPVAKRITADLDRTAAQIQALAV